MRAKNVFLAPLELEAVKEWMKSLSSSSDELSTGHGKKCSLLKKLPLLAQEAEGVCRKTFQSD
eukprot:CAMPEP_0170574496 /NCGR_PEP_ID=MMETSP0224-20130122/3329_1 /TAXON_ID=285029 /ORGANISM="Togula jolla, Strain CCCM 725" /LENGTH=62 /DNA_ID=CAMNT_0010897153 /DNA_START=266 /DNA_END=454 /DNA_ORIENTATION=+